MLVGFLWVWKDTAGVRAQLCLNGNFKLELSLCKTEWEKDGSHRSTWEMLAIHLTFHTGGYFLEFRKTWWIVNLLIPPPPPHAFDFFLSYIIRNMFSFLLTLIFSHFILVFMTSVLLYEARSRFQYFWFITHFRSGSHLNTPHAVCLVERAFEEQKAELWCDLLWVSINSTGPCCHSSHSVFILLWLVVWKLWCFCLISLEQSILQMTL